MSVISKENYETLADLLGQAFEAQKEVTPFISSGLNVVLNLDDADQEFDLLRDFYLTNESAQDVFKSADSFINVARALQQHVESRSGDTVQTFLDNEGIQVSEDFAEISKAAGFEIDSFIS